jgi:hypothetical protein
VALDDDMFVGEGMGKKKKREKKNPGMSGRSLFGFGVWGSGAAFIILESGRGLESALSVTKVIPRHKAYREIIT